MTVKGCMEICWIYCRNTPTARLLNSSGVQVNTATMKVQVSIHGIRPAPRSLTPLQASSAALLAPGGGELVLPADNSMLQFWDAARDCHVDRLQVSIQAMWTGCMAVLQPRAQFAGENQVTEGQQTHSTSRPSCRYQMDTNSMKLATTCLASSYLASEHMHGVLWLEKGCDRHHSNELAHSLLCCIVRSFMLSDCAERTS